MIYHVGWTIMKKPLKSLINGFRNSVLKKIKIFPGFFLIYVPTCRLCIYFLNYFYFRFRWSIMRDKLLSILGRRGRSIMPRHALIYTYVFLVILPLFLRSQEHNHNHNGRNIFFLFIIFQIKFGTKYYLDIQFGTTYFGLDV